MYEDIENMYKKYVVNIIIQCLFENHQLNGA